LPPRSGWNTCGGFFDVPNKEAHLTSLEEKMISPTFWDRREEAQGVIAGVSALKAVLEPFRKVAAQAEDLAVAVELAAMDGPESDLLAEAVTASADLTKALDRLELVSFLSGKMDRNNAFFSIHAGAGGTESCDWAEMLFRMYTHWFDRRGFGYEVVDCQPGDEAGIRNVTLTVTGEFAHGYVKGERGVHRLVRISPFDANKRRHTSFAAVDVMPEIADDIEIEINENDLRVDTYHSSGAGGQNVNKTASAVRLTHLPTGIVVACQAERSQHKNRHKAMKLLRAKLYELAEQKREKELAAHHGEQAENAWGSQIRSYVLQPYQLVKDLRTDVETSNVNAVLDGDLDRFVEAFLKTSKPARS